MGSGGTGKCPKRGANNDGSVVAPILALSYTLATSTAHVMAKRWPRMAPNAR